MINWVVQNLTRALGKCRDLFIIYPSAPNFTEMFTLICKEQAKIKEGINVVSFPWTRVCVIVWARWCCQRSVHVSIPVRQKIQQVTGMLYWSACLCWGSWNACLIFLHGYSCWDHCSLIKVCVKLEMYFLLGPFHVVRFTLWNKVCSMDFHRVYASLVHLFVSNWVVTHVFTCPLFVVDGSLQAVNQAESQGKSRWPGLVLTVLFHPPTISCFCRVNGMENNGKLREFMQHIIGNYATNYGKLCKKLWRIM